MSPSRDGDRGQGPAARRPLSYRLGPGRQRPHVETLRLPSESVSHLSVLTGGPEPLVGDIDHETTENERDMQPGQRAAAFVTAMKTHSAFTQPSRRPKPAVKYSVGRPQPSCIHKRA